MDREDIKADLEWVKNQKEQVIIGQLGCVF